MLMLAPSASVEVSVHCASSAYLELTDAWTESSGHKASFGVGMSRLERHLDTECSGTPCVIRQCDLALMISRVI
jgi:hypothetical protein